MSRKRLLKRRRLQHRRPRRSSSAPRARSRRSSAPRPRRKPARNPAGGLIGVSPVLHTDRGRFPFPGGRLVCGAQAGSFVVHARRGRQPPIGARVRRVDYLNAEKARRVHGRVAPWRHDFTSSPRVYGIEGRVGGAFSVYVRAAAPIWRRD